MDEPACVLCGSVESEMYRLMRCRECRLISLQDALPPESLAKLAGGYTTVIDGTLELVRATWLGRAGLALLRGRRAAKGLPPGRLLDIGCSSGSYLAFMRSRGWSVAGIESDPAAAEAARANYGLDVLSADAEQALAGGPAARFDVATLWHVLEHARNPLALLIEVRRSLRPGGSILLETPNAASLWTGLFGRCWFPWELPFHNFHFTPATLAAILQEAGFHAIRVRGAPAPAEILWSLELARARTVRRGPNGGLRWNPAAAALLYPAEWLLAQLRLSNHLWAQARRD